VDSVDDLLDQVVKRNRTADEYPLPDLPDLSAFKAMEFAARVPLLGPIHSAYVVHASGASGAGKTHLAVALSEAIGCGRDWCHWRSHDRRVVLHVDGELPPADLQARFDATPADAWIVPLSAIWLSEQAGFELGHVNLADPIWQAVIERYIERYGVTVLQLDNVMSLVFVDGVSMSSDEFWRPVAGWLRRLRGKGITSIVWDHTNAQGKTFGTKTKEWQSDLAMQLTIPDDSEANGHCKFHLEFGKTRGLHGDEVRPQVVEFSGGQWWTKPLADALVETAQELRDSGMSVRDVSTEIGKSRSWVSKYTRGSQRYDGKGVH